MSPGAELHYFCAGRVMQWREGAAPARWEPWVIMEPLLFFSFYMYWFLFNAGKDGVVEVRSDMRKI